MNAQVGRAVPGRVLAFALVLAPVISGAVALGALLGSGFALLLGPALAGGATWMYARRCGVTPRIGTGLTIASSVATVPAVLALMLLALALFVGGPDID